MYLNWLEHSPKWPLFWAFTSIITLLLLIGIYTGYNEKKKRVGDFVFYAVYVLVLLALLSGMRSMWNAFEYEKGNLGKTEYYGQGFIEHRFYPGWKAHVCISSDN